MALRNRRTSRLPSLAGAVVLAAFASAMPACWGAFPTPLGLLDAQVDASALFDAKTDGSALSDGGSRVDASSDTGPREASADASEPSDAADSSDVRTPDATADASNGADAGASPTGVVGYLYDPSANAPFDFAINDTYLGAHVGSTVYGCPMPCSTPFQAGSRLRLANTTRSMPSDGVAGDIAIDGDKTVYFAKPKVGGYELGAWDLVSNTTRVISATPATELAASGSLLSYVGPTGLATSALDAPTASPPPSRDSHFVWGGDVVTASADETFVRNGVPLPTALTAGTRTAFVAASANGARPAIIVARVTIAGHGRLRVCRGACANWRGVGVDDPATAALIDVNDIGLDADYVYLLTASGLYRMSLDVVGTGAGNQAAALAQVSPTGGELLRMTKTHLFFSAVELPTNRVGLARTITRVAIP